MTTSPLAGIQVLTCRATSQSSSLLAKIESLGGVAVSLPLLELSVPLDGGSQLNDALDRLDTFDWLVLTSANAVAAVAARVAVLPSTIQLAVVGPATAAEAQRLGWNVAFQPTAATGESLVAELPIVEAAEPRVLAPLAELAAPTIEAGLTARGAVVERVIAYRMETPQHSPGAVAEALRSDVVLLTSPSTANRLAAVAAEHWRSTATMSVAPVDRSSSGRLPRAIVIGPSSHAAATSTGFVVAAVADPHTEDGLIAALVRTIDP